MVNMGNMKLVMNFFIKPKCVNLNVENILKYSSYFSDIFKLQFSEFNFSFYKDSVKKSESFKSYKFNDNNLKKLISQNNITSVSFQINDKLQTNKRLSPEANIDFMISDECNWPSELCVSLDMSRINNESNHKSIFNFLKGTVSFGFEMYNGFTHIMDEAKFPLFYIRGIQTQNITLEEIRIVNALDKRKCSEKIWDIYLFNIIKKEIITQKIIEQVYNVVKKDNVIEINDYYIIKLPVTYNNYIYNKMETDYYKNELRFILKKESAIMYEP